jgi:hypothetical protein
VFLPQCHGVDNDCAIGLPPGPADFSRETRLALDENALVEATGMCNEPIEWNFNLSTSDILSLDINEYPDEVAECGG